MNEAECLNRMVAPGTRRPGKYREGVIQIHVTRACDKSCFNCTQGSNYRGPYSPMTPEQFEQAVLSLKGYFGVVGVFGGNPASSKYFPDYCAILRQHIPWEQRGLWCNNPLGHGRVMRETFNPAVSNLNVHQDVKAFDEFKQDWPECGPVGLFTDSRHSPVFVAMKDVLKKLCDACNGEGTYSGQLAVEGGYADTEERKTVGGPCSVCQGTMRVYDESKAWELISDCDINKHWSALIGIFRGELRAWFCEVAGAQAMLHQHEPDYPDTGLDPRLDWAVEPMSGELFAWPPKGQMGAVKWWELPMAAFAGQVRKHCHECSVPLRGYGELAQSKDGTEQFSQTHADVCQPKSKDRQVQVVSDLVQLKPQSLQRMTAYLQNSKR